ncbi:hypothetical protein [Caulobacter sp. 17J65-9]|uniref:hypothetical protein n=1 Tax=Caulobacter sp. 17J65-9 TaxID=2709382 RepID=UPI0013C9F645|nr:hypothetical protein [Caulobacter sp. 17J65-9]NEX93282.1 hypothetical protein [Caulobacter sp. 17J65-9]
MSEVARGGDPRETAASVPAVEDAVRAYLDHFWKVDAWLHALQQARVDPALPK